MKNAASRVVELLVTWSKDLSRTLLLPGTPGVNMPIQMVPSLPLTGPKQIGGGQSAELGSDAVRVIMSTSAIAAAGGGRVISVPTDSNRSSGGSCDDSDV